MVKYRLYAYMLYPIKTGQYLSRVGDNKQCVLSMGRALMLVVACIFP